MLFHGNHFFCMTDIRTEVELIEFPQRSLHEDTQAQDVVTYPFKDALSDFLPSVFMYTSIYTEQH